MTRTTLLAAALAAGCGRGPENEYHVSGAVTVGGEPVHSGRVYFTPDREKGNDGPQGVALISAGRFDTRSGGRPAPPGAVVVRVDGYGPPAGAPDPPPLVWDYTAKHDLPRNDTSLDLAIPESARVKPGKKAGPPP
jgi:hypothetical protein